MWLQTTSHGSPRSYSARQLSVMRRAERLPLCMLGMLVLMKTPALFCLTGPTPPPLPLLRLLLLLLLHYYYSYSYSYYHEAPIRPLVSSFFLFDFVTVCSSQNFAISNDILYVVLHLTRSFFSFQHTAGILISKTTPSLTLTRMYVNYTHLVIFYLSSSFYCRSYFFPLSVGFRLVCLF